MNIVVCVKQVPDTADIKWTKNNTLQREGMDSVINPFDEYAIETALRIKDDVENVKVKTVSMGPKQAENTLRETLALGCDEAYLVSDKKFSAADTVATSTTLASSISAICPDFDLIICGQFATDGDTAQTGPGIAEKLRIPQVTYVRKVVEINESEMTVEKEGEYGIETLKVKLPALICVQKCDYELRQAKIDGYIFAQNSIVPTIALENLELKEEQVGIKGSPTYVSKAFRPEAKRNIEFIDEEKLVELLKQEGK